MNADEIVSVAEGFLGVRENPPDSNDVLFNTHFYGREVSGPAYPWCVAFQWDVFRLAGASALFYGGGKTASCGALLRYAKAHGQWVTGPYERGDLVIFDFELDGDLDTDHVGLVTRVNDDGTLSTIEGNTGAGSDSNGGEVMRRTRPLRYVVGAYRPDYRKDEGGDEMTQEQFDAMMDAYLAELAQREPSAWSADARAWAEEKGLITGDERGNKQYKKFCTREELVTILRRYDGGETR